MAATYLDSIVAAHRQRAAIDSRDWRQRTVATSGAGFEKALREHREHGNAVIAEVKRSSPSKGALNVDLDAETLARAYVAGERVQFLCSLMSSTLGVPSLISTPSTEQSTYRFCARTSLSA